MGRITGPALAALVLCACSSAALPAATPKPTPSATTAAAVLASGGCGSTPVLQGAIPKWLDDSGAHNNPVGVPYIIARPAVAAGFLFGYPLRAGHPDNPSNKILWVVRTARNGPLTLDGHPLGQPAPLVQAAFPDDASPGQIYPSGVDVPSAGCWHFALHWQRVRPRSS